MSSYKVDVCDLCKTEIKSNQKSDIVKVANSTPSRKGKKGLWDVVVYETDNIIKNIEIDFSELGVDGFKFEICIRCANKLSLAIFSAVKELKKTEVE